MLLDYPPERTRAEMLVVALLGEPGASAGVKLDRDVAIGELFLELQDEFVDDAADRLRRQRREGAAQGIAAMGSAATRLLISLRSVRRSRRKARPVHRRRHHSSACQRAPLSHVPVIGMSLTEIALDRQDNS